MNKTWLYFFAPFLVLGLGLYIFQHRAQEEIASPVQKFDGLKEINQTAVTVIDGISRKED